MIELSFEYWNKLAEQIIFISALLGGFSITVIASLLYAKESDRVSINLLRASTIVAASFLVAIFTMTKIIMMTTKGFPMEVNESDLTFPRIIGFASFLSGIISLMVIISLSGWTISRKVGLFTTTVGILALLLIFIMLT